MKTCCTNSNHRTVDSKAYQDAMWLFHAYGAAKALLWYGVQKRILIFATKFAYPTITKPLEAQRLASTMEALGNDYPTSLLSV